VILKALMTLRTRYKLCIHACHIDYQNRDESGREADFLDNVSPYVCVRGSALTIFEIREVSISAHLFFLYDRMYVYLSFGARLKSGIFPFSFCHVQYPTDPNTVVSTAQCTTDDRSYGLNKSKL
jgi:hypothetical protein